MPVDEVHERLQRKIVAWIELVKCPSTMASVSQAASPSDIQRIRRLLTITIAWMIAEAALSLFSAWRAHSPALVAFGGDSAIELISAVVVLWRFRGNAVPEQAEKLAAQVAGILLFLLAGCVALTSAISLLGYAEPEPTLLGMVVLLSAAIVMPWLAREKRRLSAATDSAALRADAAESAMCGYLSMIALLGVAANAIWHIHWTDPVAALIILPLILSEGREAMRGNM